MRELERREEEMEIQVSGEQQLVGPAMVRVVVMHTVPQEGQKRPALNSINDFAKTIPRPSKDLVELVEPVVFHVFLRRYKPKKKSFKEFCVLWQSFQIDQYAKSQGKPHKKTYVKKHMPKIPVFFLDFTLFFQDCLCG